MNSYRQTTIAALFCLSACGDGTYISAAPPPPPPAAVSVEDSFEVIRHWPLREITRYAGEHVWSADAEGGLFISDDSGYSWTRLDLPVAGAVVQMQVEDKGRRGYVVNDDGIMMRTDDGGSTWTEINLIEAVGDDVDTRWGDEYDMHFEPGLVNGEWIGFCQILQTTDGGKSWTRHADGLQDTGGEEYCVADAVHDPETGEILASVDVYGRMLTSGDYLFLSEDDGKTWTEICSLDEVGMLIQRIPSCHDYDEYPDNVVAATERFVGRFAIDNLEEAGEFTENLERYIFIDGVAPIPPNYLDRLDLFNFERDPTSGRIWYSLWRGLAWTDNRGDSWHVMASEMPENENIDFSLGLDRGFAIYEHKHLAVTRDAGRIWQAINLDPVSLYNIVVLPEEQRIVATTGDGVVIVDAETLDYRQVPIPGHVYDLVAAGSVLWSFSSNDPAHRSIDGGVTWSQVPINVGVPWDISVHQARCNAESCLLYGGRDDEAFGRLTADPFSFEFTELSGEIPGYAADYISEVVLGHDTKRAWLAMESGRLFATTDGGRTVEQVGDLGDEIRDLYKSPVGDAVMAMGYSNRYLWSGDGREFEVIDAPSARDAYLNEPCWLDDSTVLLRVDFEEEDSQYLASLDGGRTWGSTDLDAMGDDCRIRGGYVTLVNGLVKAK